LDHIKTYLGTTSWQRPGHKADGPSEWRGSASHHGTTAADAPEIAGLSVVYIQAEATSAFKDEIRDQEEKQHLLVRGGRTLNEGLN
jgi:hypothetical protein